MIVRLQQNGAALVLFCLSRIWKIAPFGLV
jgi:hypothetical protein